MAQRCWLRDTRVQRAAVRQVRVFKRIRKIFGAPCIERAVHDIGALQSLRRTVECDHLLLRLSAISPLG
jgi:hypothetical protein